ncbi:dNA internalization-related competence protein ComEC/Rec2 [Clostridium sp. CAG:452]|jgi:competence protein ComEC|nr:dNA internalization-related competence protein ComEC/Rec2 [Clostridium sp. CAG:452]
MLVALIGNTQVLYLKNKYLEIYKDDKNIISATAVVIKGPSEGEYNYKYTVKARTGKYKNKKFIVYINKKNKKLLEYGDLIEIKGEYSAPEVARNYKGFDYSQYLKTLNIYGTIKVEESKIINKNQLSPILISINNIKEKMIDNANRNMPKRTANLLLGILIGERDNIQEDIIESFRTANLSHILAVSGAHTSYIILGITYLISKSKTPKRIGYIITIINLLIFIIITGASYSVVRACIMAIVVIGAKICYRKENFFTSICISLIIILIQNPFAINDIGLKLSFMGTAGIVIFNKSITNFFIKLKIKQKIAEALSVTFSAQLMIMPITILNFNTISLTFFISNILASPLLGIIIIFGFISIFISSILNPISKILFLILHIFLELLILVSKVTEKIPGSSILVKTPNILFAIVYYILILFFNYFFVIKQNPTRRFHKKIIKIITIKNIKNAFKVIAVVFLIILLLTRIVRIINPTLKIYFIDVGQGDSTLIVTPKNKKILIDGGEGKTNVLFQYLLDRRINKIDYIIISHFDSDHCNGLIEIIEKMRVENIVMSKQSKESEEYKKILEIIKQKNIKVSSVKAEDKIIIEKNLYTKILNPAEKFEFQDLNNNAIVAKLVYKNFSMLFTGDIEKAEENLAKKYKNELKSTILKVAHHGSKTSTSEEFLKYVEPQIALIGVGENNKFGHPNQITIEKLKNIRSQNI